MLGCQNGPKCFVLFRVKGVRITMLHFSQSQKKVSKSKYPREEPEFVSTSSSISGGIPSQNVTSSLWHPWGDRSTVLHFLRKKPRKPRKISEFFSSRIIFPRFLFPFFFWLEYCFSYVFRGFCWYSPFFFHEKCSFRVVSFPRFSLRRMQHCGIYSMPPCFVQIQ